MENSSELLKKLTIGWGHSSSMVEHLPSKSQALSSNPNTTKKEKKS
jgi:hypothetical protein